MLEEIPLDLFLNKFLNILKSLNLHIVLDCETRGVCKFPGTTGSHPVILAIGRLRSGGSQFKANSGANSSQDPVSTSIRAQVAYSCHSKVCSGQRCGESWFKDTMGTDRLVELHLNQ
jgi:hypothetical protein